MFTNEEIEEIQAHAVMTGDSVLANWCDRALNSKSAVVRRVAIGWIEKILERNDSK